MTLLAHSPGRNVPPGRGFPVAVTHPTLDSALYDHSTKQLQLEESNMHNSHAKKEKRIQFGHRALPRLKGFVRSITTQSHSWSPSWGSG